MPCPNCGFENPDAFAFCGRCGSPMASTVRGHASEDRSSRAERRQLTVMFVDLVGSTALSERLDPEDMSDLTREYQRVCAEVIDRYEGRIAQYLGDGLLVYFGYPVSHEDDPQRAIRASLEILSAISQAAEKVGKPLHVRIGIHTGLVVVGQLGGKDNPDPMAVAGETPNVAARLQAIAEPGTVIISAATYRLVEGFFICRSIGSPTLKGLASPIELYSVIEESGIRTRFEKAVASGLIPLVGREQELDFLLKAWQRARDGNGQVVTVSGEAGVGKSRLVQALIERTAGEPFSELCWRCSPYYQNSALHPVIEFLQRMLRFSRKDDAAARFAKLEQALEQFGFSLPEAVPLLAGLLSLPSDERYPALPMSPQRQKLKTFETIIAWMLRGAERGPIRVLVEDLQWADPSTLELIELLIERTSDQRLLVMLTFRPEFVPAWHARAHLGNVIPGRLSRSQTELMIESIAGGKQLPAEVLSEIAVKTEGVPLFVEELTRMVLESELIRERDGRYELTGPLPTLAIPSTLHDSLMTRLDRLGTAKEVAQMAAIIGREFSYELLQAISPLEETRLTGALNRLVDAELLEESLSPRRVSYRFRHALIRDAAYESLLRSQRRRYHQKIAEVLRDRFPDTVQAQPELLANHLTEAALIDNAVPHWQLAGQRALERSANQEAIGHLTKGLQLLGLLPQTPAHLQQELQMCVTLGAAFMVARGFASSEAQGVYARARILCEQVGGGPLTFPVFWALWVFHAARAEHRKAREAGEECLRLAEIAHDSGLLLQAHHALGVSLLLLGQFAEGLRHLEQGAAIYDPDQHAALAFIYGQDSGVACLAYQGWALWFLGYPDQARSRTLEALGLADKLSHPVSSAAAANIACWVYQFLQDHDAAHEQAEAAVVLSTHGQFEFWKAIGMIGQGWAMTRKGAVNDGIARLRIGLKALRSTGAEVVMPYFLTLLAQAQSASGQIEEAHRLLDESQTVLNESGEAWWHAELYRLKGELLLKRTGRKGEGVKQAEEYFCRAYAIAHEQCAKSLQLRAALSISCLWGAQGRKSEARQILADAYGLFTEGLDTKDLREAQELQDQLSSD
jgi:predicted ATPase/class 3 adenylate cyclase